MRRLAGQGRGDRPGHAACQHDRRQLGHQAQHASGFRASGRRARLVVAGAWWSAGGHRQLAFRAEARQPDARKHGFCETARTFPGAPVDGSSDDSLTDHRPGATRRSGWRCRSWRRPGRWRRGEPPHFPVQADRPPRRPSPRLRTKSDDGGLRRRDEALVGHSDDGDDQGGAVVLADLLRPVVHESEAPASVPGFGRDPAQRGIPCARLELVGIRTARVGQEYAQRAEDGVQAPLGIVLIGVVGDMRRSGAGESPATPIPWPRRPLPGFPTSPSMSGSMPRRVRAVSGSAAVSPCGRRATGRGRRYPSPGPVLLTRPSGSCGSRAPRRRVRARGRGSRGSRRRRPS
ncbi:hypothetical protein SAMN05421854_110271 [Amycolatopsis rubida]|uniref:Uncharacterized protein n=1 Tax=Amycolatopsis rubida TaxID=112413 RepID=A0A1I5XJ62_9PSEU|nr:hypothetical protein SAMN05421854_110271 [Amycolatopsis rubida]